jgi:polyhydroxyalkanoate synthesis regulator phasin
MSKTLSRSLAVVAMVVVGCAAPALAQVSETDQLQQLRANVLADRQAVVAGNLGLTDAEGESFWPVYREYRSEMAKVGDRLQKLIQDYAMIYDSATEAQAKNMVDELMAIQQQQLKVKRKYLPRFRKVLTEIKVARLLQIENKVDAIIAVGLAADIPLVTAEE